MELSGRKINDSERPLVIAEIGINHGGNLELAKKMVSLAVRSGVECIKHQTHFVEDEMTEEAKDIYPPHMNESIWDLIANCALTKDEEIELKNFTEDLGVIYLSTPFSRSAADFLNDIDVKGFKIGSGEANNIPLVRHIASFKKPIILSTGMNSLSSIKKSVEIIEKAEIEYGLLECTNLYPSPPSIVSLKGIKELKKTFPQATVGFSDHSIGPSIALAAVALGATIIERHFTDTRYRKGPDIVCSMDPAELRFLIDRSKEIHIAINNPKERTKEEEAVYKFARGSIVADRNLAKGAVITEKDIWARRPGTGQIPAYEFDQVVGRVLKRDVLKNTQIKWDYFH